MRKREDPPLHPTPLPHTGFASQQPCRVRGLRRRQLQRRGGHVRLHSLPGRARRVQQRHRRHQHGGRLLLLPRRHEDEHRRQLFGRDVRGVRGGPLLHIGRVCLHVVRVWKVQRGGSVGVR